MSWSRGTSPNLGSRSGVVSSHWTRVQALHRSSCHFSGAVCRETLSPSLSFWCLARLLVIGIPHTPGILIGQGTGTAHKPWGVIGSVNGAAGPCRPGSPPSSRVPASRLVEDPPHRCQKFPHAHRAAPATLKNAAPSPRVGFGHHR